jgi:hypothetical protein
MTDVKEQSTKLLLDLPYGRYSLYDMAREWVRALQRSDDTKNMGHSDLVKRAIEDIAYGRVTEPEIQKLKKEREKAGIPVDEHIAKETAV